MSWWKVTKMQLPSCKNWPECTTTNTQRMLPPEHHGHSATDIWTKIMADSCLYLPQQIYVLKPQREWIQNCFDFTESIFTWTNSHMEYNSGQKRNPRKYWFMPSHHITPKRRRPLRNRDEKRMLTPFTRENYIYPTVLWKYWQRTTLHFLLQFADPGFSASKLPCSEAQNMILLLPSTQRILYLIP